MSALDTVQTRTGPMPVYVAVPEGVGPWPGVVVIHDVFGMTDNTRHHADWLASFGFIAIAPSVANVLSFAPYSLALLPSGLKQLAMPYP